MDSIAYIDQGLPLSELSLNKMKVNRYDATVYGTALTRVFFSFEVVPLNYTF